jgi:hypothetical protein
MAAPEIFEKQIEIKLLHPASTLESRIQVKKTMILLLGLSTGLSCVANDESLAASKADTEISEVVLNAAGGESESDSSSKGGYVLEGNKNLKLCHEFLEVLNNKPGKYYVRPKSIDKKIEQFVPIKMTPVDKEQYFIQIGWLSDEPPSGTLNGREKVVS